MARKRSDTSGGIIWPGFVDAMTALLLVLMFVLSIFMVVQFLLREELIGKDRTLEELGATLVSLRAELTSERRRTQDFRDQIATLEERVAAEEEKALRLGQQLEEAEAEGVRLTETLERRIAELAATAQALEGREKELAALQAREDEIEAVEQENIALRQAAEAARETQLTLEERITALELALDQKRAEAEETLVLLAAAEAKEKELSAEAIESAKALTERERLNAFARAALAAEEDLNKENRAAIALLNAQIRDLREQIGGLELQLRITEQKEEAAQIQISDLGRRLNRALARKVDELQRYRSEFFGRLRDVLAGRPGVEVVGDRFVFQSEILFDSGSADLGPKGQEELGRFAEVLRQVYTDIPSELPWVLRVDGHTDRVPLKADGDYANNWELSQARALSVVSYLINEQSIPATRLAAAGFGQHHPIDQGYTAEAFAKNRRIELKLTER